MIEFILTLILGGVILAVILLALVGLFVINDALRNNNDLNDEI
jgi:hypothetical protein